METLTSPAPPPEETRFAFGENWRSFLELLDEERVERAVESLLDMLGLENLSGKRFLDAGCGSGLFSLAAIRAGAQLVHSFDLDPQSVGCALELRRRFAIAPERWKIESGSVLDGPYLESLGTWDVVYSWGVLHHTGEMWRALDLAAQRVAPKGRLFIAIYNDQGLRSRLWTGIKRIYNRLPSGLRPAYAFCVMAPQELASAGVLILTFRWRRFADSFLHYKRRRGMSRRHDNLDWIGGYPFEVARPEEIVRFHRPRGLVLEREKNVGPRRGCNQFVFRQEEGAPNPAEPA